MHDDLIIVNLDFIFGTCIVHIQIEMNSAFRMSIVK